MHLSRLRFLLACALVTVPGCFVDALGGGLDAAGGAGGATSASSTASDGSSSVTSASGTTTSNTVSAVTSSGTGGEGGSGPGPCPVGWTLGALMDCYRVVPPDDPNGVDKDEAEALCGAAAAAVGAAGRLASPNNTPDIAMLETLGGAQFDIWTSGTYAEGAPNAFVWEGSPDAFTFQGGQAPWAGNQPDNMPGESCVIITDGALHTYECWDVDFSQPFAAGCEIVP